MDQIVSQVAVSPKTVALTPLISGRPASASVNASALSLSFDDAWHPAETFGRWSAATTSTVEFALAPLQRSNVARSLVISLKFFAPSRKSKPFKVCLNGKAVYEIPAVAEGSLKNVIIDLPSETVRKDGRNSLEFHFKPSAETKAQNPRILGVGLVSIEMVSRDQGNILAALENPQVWSGKEFKADFALLPHTEALAKNLTRTAGWGVGSPLGHMQFLLPILTQNWTMPNTKDDKILKLEIRPVASSDHPVTVTAKINGQVQAVETYDSSTPQDFLIPLETKKAQTSAPILLTIETDGGMTPPEIGLSSMSNDQIIIGCGVFGMELQSAHATTSKGS
ncbi:hypothetical protein [Pseudooctadecabacter sp.]|uniref:hypothetical protein n=1 Tax=Pseudooctadecabacter sp. TaxID=1966338 RepID=UPI003F6BF31C